MLTVRRNPCVPQTEPVLQARFIGLSHGLKTVHRTVFTAAKAAAGLSSPITHQTP